jgi:2-haloacid dehalogenase
LFDADGTLFDYDRAERAALEKALAQIGVSFDPGYLAAYQRINQALWQGVEKGPRQQNVWVNSSGSGRRPNV